MRSEPRRDIQRATVTIDDINHDGEGVGRTADGFVLFVPGGLPGETVDVVIRERKRRFGRATLEAIRVAAVDRQVPPCPVAGECGGCALQHYAYHQELAWKQERVRSALERIGGFASFEIESIVGMDHPFHYRNKAQYPVRRAADGTATLGFFRRGSHDVVDARDCLIHHPLIVETAEAVRRLIGQLNLSVDDGRGESGSLRHVVIRASFARREAMVIAVTVGTDFPKAQRWVEGLRDAVGEVTSVVQSVHSGKGNAVLGEETRVLWGSPTIIEEIDGLKLQISANSFFQVNSAQAARLFQIVRAWAELRGDEVVWDVYCGGGSIGLFMAPSVREVRGIERVGAAVRDAIANAELNGVYNARFEVGEAETTLPRWVEEGGSPDVCILDPPRKGCDPRTLLALSQCRPRKILYVSCNPSTLARDLAIMAEHGFRLARVRPVDMFPHTPHVEAVAELLHGQTGKIP